MRGDGINMVAFPQTPANLEAAASNLLKLVSERNIVSYPSDELRTAIGNCRSVETIRGFRISKIVGSRKIDLAAALSFAALAVVKAPPEPGIIGFYREEAEEVHRWEEEDKQRTQPRSPSEEAEEMCRRQREQEARLAPGAHRLAQELIDILEGRGKGRDHGSYSDEPPGPPSPLARPFVIGWPRR